MTEKLITSDKEIINMAENLKVMMKIRTRIRRKLCKYLRDNEVVFENDKWINRKIKLRYLGDLSDDQLIYYVKYVGENKNGN